MKKILDIIFVGLISISVFNCNKSNPVKPSEGQPPNSRDYTWNVDTLNVQFLGQLWGGSPNDIWAVEQYSYFLHRLWHYDGEKWAEYTKENLDCSCFTIYGFSANDIWIGGVKTTTDNGAIWHYDGTSWTENYIYEVKGAVIMSIWGNSPNDIYASGYISDSGNQFGFILHYDGVIWKEVLRANNYTAFYKMVGDRSNDKIYVLNYKLNEYSSSHDTVAYEELNGDKLNEIYANTVNNIHWGTCANIDGVLYFLLGQDIYLYMNGQFVKKTNLSNHADPFQYHIFGRSANDIFICMGNGLAQYNGSNIDYVYKFSQNVSSYEREDAIFDKELFCVFKDFDNNKTLILHGKLK